MAFIVSAPSNGFAVPIGDAFASGQNEIEPAAGFHPRNDTVPTVHPSLHPTLTSDINEPHPIPDYIKKLTREGEFSRYYLELLQVSPVNKVQSKVFNRGAFKKIRRIGVWGFENKTTAPFKDKTAGDVVAKQISRQLQSYPQYKVTPPPRMTADARFKIVTTPTVAPSVRKEKEVPPAPRLPYSSKQVDAVMIGAVTKFMDSYRDNHGRIKKSISSGVEFGAFLVSTRTGEVIWGARYVANQSPSMVGFFENQGRWLSKKDLSESAMKHVLKAFQESRVLP